MRSHWEIVGQAIREARQETEQSQRNTAIRLGMKPSDYSKIEDGEDNPDVVLDALMRALVDRDEVRKHLQAANKGAEINAHVNNSLTAKLTEAREKPKLLKIFNLNDLIFFTFRYFLGRMTIATVGFAEKLAEAYPLLSERNKILIRKELEQAYEEAERVPEWKPLGDDADRRAWDLVKKETEKWA